MRTKILIALLVVVAFIPGCANIHNPLPPEAPEIPDVPDIPQYGKRDCPKLFPDPDPIPYSLTGTKWKLVGKVKVETGEMYELEGTTGAGTYTLTFDTDTTALVFCITTSGKIDLLHLNPCVIKEEILICEDGICDSALFWDGIVLTAYYSITTTEIKLFYNYAENYYLLFKRVEL